METFNVPLNMEALRKAFEAREQFNVTKEEIETVLHAVLSNYIKDGWAHEVLAFEVCQLRDNAEQYKQDAGIGD